MHKKNFHAPIFKNKNKHEGKKKFEGKNKTSQSANFKKKGTSKKKEVSHVCGADDHWASACKNRFDMCWHENNKKSANLFIGDTEMKDGRVDNVSTVLSVCHSSERWIDMGENIHVCADIFIFLLIRSEGLLPC